MKNLANVTLIGADCVDIDRLLLAADICQKDFEFGAVKLLSSTPSFGFSAGSLLLIASTLNPVTFCCTCSVVGTAPLTSFPLWVLRRPAFNSLICFRTPTESLTCFGIFSPIHPLYL